MIKLGNINSSVNISSSVKVIGIDLGYINDNVIKYLILVNIKVLMLIIVRLLILCILVANRAMGIQILGMLLRKREVNTVICVVNGAYQ